MGANTKFYREMNHVPRGAPTYTGMSFQWFHGRGWVYALEKELEKEPHNITHISKCCHNSLWNTTSSVLPVNQCLNDTRLHSRELIFQNFAGRIMDSIYIAHLGKWSRSAVPREIHLIDEENECTVNETTWISAGTENWIQIPCLLLQCFVY